MDCRAVRQTLKREGVNISGLRTALIQSTGTLNEPTGFGLPTLNSCPQCSEYEARQNALDCLKLSKDGRREEGNAVHELAGSTNRTKKLLRIGHYRVGTCNHSDKTGRCTFAVVIAGRPR